MKHENRHFKFPVTIDMGWKIPKQARISRTCQSTASILRPFESNSSCMRVVENRPSWATHKALCCLSVEPPAPSKCPVNASSMGSQRLRKIRRRILVKLGLRAPVSPEIRPARHETHAAWEFDPEYGYTVYFQAVTYDDPQHRDNDVAEQERRGRPRTVRSRDPEDLFANLNSRALREMTDTAGVHLANCDVPGQSGQFYEYTSLRDPANPHEERDVW